MSAINKMSNKKVTMMKLRRIIQMLSEGYSQNEICRETSSSKTTVSGYKKMADGTKLSYRELLLMENSELEALLQPKLAALPPDPRKAELEALMPEVMKRLSKRYATVELVHQDFYLKQCPGGYGYTQFNKPFKGRTRWQIFTEDEKPNMNPLPAEMHRFRHRKTVKLGSSYHVCVGSERHMYSVPYNYVGRMVTVMWDMEYVEVFLGTMRLCVHRRSYEAYGYTTDKNHMPESHKAYERSREYNAAALIERAGFIGQSMKWVVETMLSKTRFPQQAYMHCNAALALVKEYGCDRLEHACQMMKTETSTASLKVLSNILKNSRDLAGREGDAMTSLASGDDVRGEAHYARIVGRKEGANE